MSILSVYHQSSPDTPNKVLTHGDDIAATLAEQGVRFEQRELAERIRPGTAVEEVLATLGSQLDAVKGGLAVVEALSVNPEHPQKEELRAGWIDERRHTGEGVYFFVSGRGLLNLRIGEYVYALVGERGDLVGVPARAAHWLDIGEQPNLLLLQWFANEDGRTVEFTDDDSARLYPGLDDTF